MILADKIIKLRKQNNWSQEDLAEKMNVSRQSVSKWEGAQSVPDLDKILQLSQIFGVSTDYLLKDAYEEDVLAVDEYQPETGRRISLEEADAFIEKSRQTAYGNGIATFLCITCAAPLIFLAGLFGDSNVAAGVGTIIILCMVCVGVVLFVMMAGIMNPYAYIEEEELILSYGVESMAEDRIKKGSTRHTILQSIGVALCILCSVPLLISAFAEASEAILCSMVSLLLVIVGIAVCLFIVSSGERAACQKLLQQGDYTKSNKRASKLLAPIRTSYWLLVTALYLAWSFYTMNWTFTWIVWVVAGVLYPIVAAIVKTVIGATDKK